MEYALSLDEYEKLILVGIMDAESEVKYGDR